MPRRYVMSSPISAVAIQRSARTVITVPSASVIAVAQPVDALQGLIEVALNGETVLMFAEDIRQRGKLLTEPAAVGANVRGKNETSE
jgi:hypothetical protein